MDHDETPADPLDTLTQRELEVLALVADHLTNEEVAKALVVTPETVKTHVAKHHREAECR